MARGCKDQLMEPHKLSTDLPKDNGCAEISFSEELQVKLEENLNMLVSGSVCFCKGKNCNGAQMASQESFLSGNTSDLKSLTQKIPSHDITATPTSLDLSTQMTNQVIATSVLNQYVTTAHEDMIEGSTGVAALSDDLSVVNELNEPIDESRNQIETMSNNSAGVTVPDYDFQHLFKEFESEVGSGESLSLSERLEINSMDNQTDKFSTVAGLLQKNITRVKQTLVEKRDEKITKIPQIHFNEPFNQANRLYFSFLLAVLMIAIKF